MPLLFIRLINLGPRRHALLLLGGAVLCIVVGGAVFAATQHLPVTTGWYWAITTATTVGYGDVTPKNASGRVVASVVMLTTIPLLAAAFAVMTGSAVANRVRRLLEMGARFPDGSYVLVVGLHPAVHVVLDELDRAGEAVVLIGDADPATVPERVHFVRGDPTSPAVLVRGRPPGARRILIATEDDGDTLVVAVLLHQEAPAVPVTALVSASRLTPALADLGVDQVLSPDNLAGHVIAKGLEAPHAGDLLMHLVSGEQHRMVEQQVQPGEPVRPLSAVRAARDELVLGVLHGGSVSLGVSADPDVHPGDVLLVVVPDVRAAHHRTSAHRPAGAGEPAAAGEP